MTVIHLKKKDIVKSSVKGVAVEFDHEKLASILGIPGNNGICSGENRRRDDNIDAPEGEAEKEEERNQDDFDWEEVIEEAAVEGKSGSGEKFYDAEDKDHSSPEANEEIQRRVPRGSARRRNKALQESTPRVLLAEFLKLR
ncbi:hypothetical protein Dimus_008354 [Dionaea muscipula]